MKHNKPHVAANVVILLSLAVTFFAKTGIAVSKSTAGPVPQTAVTPHQKKLIDSFNHEVKEYLEDRDKAKKHLPKLFTDATPEQIKNYQTAFVNALRAARANAKRGEIFKPAIAEYIRTTIKADFKGSDRAEIRKTVLDAETKGVPLRINYPYPDEQEVTQMSPTVLLKLPELPKEVKYRFVRRTLLLVDTDSDLIIDYMPDALP